MITVEIDSKNVMNMLTGLEKNLPKAMDRGINKFTERLANQIRLEAVKRGHKTTGYLSGRGTKAVRIAQGDWAIMMPYYTPFLEKGVIRSKGIPPVRKVLLWQKKHGIRLAGKLITKPHPFTQYVINRELKRLKTDVESEVNKTVRRKGR